MKKRTSLVYSNVFTADKPRKGKFIPCMQFNHNGGAIIAGLGRSYYNWDLRRRGWHATNGTSLSWIHGSNLSVMVTKPIVRQNKRK